MRTLSEYGKTSIVARDQTVPAVATQAPTPDVPRDGEPQLAPDALTLAPVAASGTMIVELADVDGVVSPNQDDLRGSVKAELSINKDFLLSQLRDTIKSDASKTVTRVDFDPKRNAYVIEGHAKLGGFQGPSFEVTMTADATGRLVVEGHSWADLLLWLFGQPTVTDRVARSIQALQAPIQISREGNHIVIESIGNLTVPLGSERIALALTDYVPEAGRGGPFRLEPDGSILASFDGKIKGSLLRGKSNRPADEPDRAALQVQFVVRSDRSVSTRVTGSATLGITQDQLVDLTGGRAEILFPLLTSASARIGDLRIDGTYSEAGNWEARMTGRAKVVTPEGLLVDAPFDARLNDAGKTLDFEAGPVAYRDPFNGDLSIDKVSLHQGPDGVNFEVSQAPTPSLDVPYQDNRLGLWLGGDRYFRELMKIVETAREGIAIETLGYSAGDRPEQLLEALLARAGGLGNMGYTGQAVKVRLLVDPSIGGNFAGRVRDTLEGKGDEAWARRWLEDVRGGKGRYAAIPPAQREAFLARVRDNLLVVTHPGGVARADHRKVVVVDGLLGITGGVNIGEGHLSTVQDVMVPVIGPAARDLAEAFLRTWEEDGGQVTDSDRAAFVKPDEAISSQGGARFGHLVATGPAQARALVTDDKQQEIETAYLEAIELARRSIKLEQQYITDERVVGALVRAVRRGVDVTIVVPEDRDDEFGVATNLSLLKLLEASASPGGGKMDLRYYQTRGEWPYYVHSKLLVVDAERTLVGSANVEQRAMRGLAWTGEGRLLWNKELDLDIADTEFALRVDRELFGKDAGRSESRDLWEKIASVRIEGTRATALERFHKGAPAAEVQEDLARELQTRYRSEAASLLQAMGGDPAEQTARTTLQAVLGSTDRTWAAQWQQTAKAVTAAREAALGFKQNPAASEAKLRALGKQMNTRLGSALPAGRGHDVERYLVEAPLDALVGQLKAHPDASASWFVEQLAGAWALATSRVALNRLEGALGDAYRAGGFGRHEAVARQALRPDEHQAQVSEALAKLL